MSTVWSCEAGCGHPVSIHKNTLKGWQCQTCTCQQNPIRTVALKRLGNLEGGIGGGIDTGEPTKTEKRRKTRLLLLLLLFILLLVGAGAIIFSNTIPKTNNCQQASNYHLQQAETDPNNATLHYQAADTYLKAEIYGHKCKWQPPNQAGAR